MPELTISPITDADVAAVIALWQRCGLTRPWNDPAGDIAFARRGTNATILIGRAASTVALVYLLGLFILIFAPETKGRPLPE